VALVADDGWERRPELMFALEVHRAECEFLTGALAAAEARLTMLSSRAATTIEHATVACLRVDLYTTLDRSDRAVDVGLTYLRHLGVEWSPHPTEEEARREYERTWALLGSREIEELIDLPVMSDPVSLATLEVLTKVVAPALYTDANLCSLANSRMVNLSLEHGNTDASCAAYVALGVFIAGPRFGDYDAGFRFGQLGYDLVEHRGWQRFKARIYMGFGHLIMPWTQHVRTGRDLVRRAFEVAHAIGDLRFGPYSSTHLITNLLAAGDLLVDVQREAEEGLEVAEKARFGLVIDSIAAQLGLIRTLRGLTLLFGCFNDERFDERRVERRLSSNPMLARAECWYWIRKLQARFFAGDYVSAVEASVAAHRLLWTSPSNFETAEAHFYGALSHAASCDAALPAQYLQHVEALTAHHRQLREWAEHCPENFANRAALVGAEIARLEGRELDAERLYEQAIRSARANGFVHHEALAHELAARFYAARGFETIAQAYLRQARYGYRRWGADGKVRQLDQLYPCLRTEEVAAAPTGTIGAPVDHLDLATVLKVSQAVAGELVLEQLLDTLLRTALEQAGAERGLLLLPRGDELRLAAEATTRGDTVSVRLTDQAMATTALPKSIVQYVMRTQDSVLLDDAAAPHAFAADAARGAPHARSILCVPLRNQARLTGVLYLENTLTPYVFTPTRSAVLTLLASQAAISLENARLYAERQRAEEALRQTQAELAHMARLTTLGELTASIAHEINQPLGAMVNNANACVRWLAAENLARAQQSAVRIVADGQRAADTITRIRALAQNAPPHKDWLDFNDTIRDVLALARSEVHRHGVVVETQLAAAVPRIRGDRIQLQQVLLNLLMNALEAMSGGGDGPRVVVVRSAPDAMPGVLVAVGDSGPGLDPQQLDRLFDAFYTTKPQGLGLGLAISRRIIEAHGGRLWVTANVPHGAVFQFTLPIGSEEGA
jgi:signal transduction histidine kinase